ncbi:MAG: hypothetical protein BWY77_00327 [bacterium ADurb.Bin431]|nr:MAG: hypothetical protein BWY77_00327 [bacterium ADurb.Bin431]
MGHEEIDVAEIERFFSSRMEPHNQILHIRAAKEGGGIGCKVAHTPGCGDVKDGHRDQVEIVVPGHRDGITNNRRIIHFKMIRFIWHRINEKIPTLISGNVLEIRKSITFQDSSKIMKGKRAEYLTGTQEHGCLEVGKSLKDRRGAIRIISDRLTGKWEKLNLHIIGCIYHRFVGSVGRGKHLTCCGIIRFIWAVDRNPACHHPFILGQFSFLVQQGVAGQYAAAVARKIEGIAAAAGVFARKLGDLHGQFKIVRLILDAPILHEGEIGHTCRHQSPVLINAPDIDIVAGKKNGDAEIVRHIWSAHPVQEHAGEILGIAMLQEEVFSGLDRLTNLSLLDDTVDADEIIGAWADLDPERVMDNVSGQHLAFKERQGLAFVFNLRHRGVLLPGRRLHQIQGCLLALSQLDIIRSSRILLAGR